MSWKSLARASSKSVPQECQIGVPSKSVLPERCAIVSSKGVLQECHLSVSRQGVPQVGSLENVISIASVPQHTCRHSGLWASSCLFLETSVTTVGWGFDDRSCCPSWPGQRHPCGACVTLPPTWNITARRTITPDSQQLICPQGFPVSPWTSDHHEFSVNPKYDNVVFVRGFLDYILLVHWTGGVFFLICYRL